METKEITTENLAFPEVEKLLSETRIEVMDIAKRDGKYTGLKNVPGLTDATCAPHLAPIKTFAEQKRSAALTILQPDMHISAIERIDTKLKEQEEEITSRIKELEHLNDVDRRELDGKCPPEKCKSNLFGWILTVANGISDLAFNAGAFEALGDSLGFAIGIALGVAVATFVLAKGIIYSIRRAFEGDKKWYVFAGGLSIIAICGFWVLSGFRSSEMAANGVSGSVSPISFLMLNLFFFVAAIVIGVMFFPADKQPASDRELARRFALVKEREAEIKSLKEKLNALKSDAVTERKKHLAILSYTVHTMNRFRAIYFEAVAIWKSTNLLCRPDRSMPVSFSESVPDLDPLQFNLPPSLNIHVA